MELEASHANGFSDRGRTALSREKEPWEMCVFQACKCPDETCRIQQWPVPDLENVKQVQG